MKRSFSLYAHSLRHLRPIQVSARISSLVRRRLLYRNSDKRFARQRPAPQDGTRNLAFPPPATIAHTQHEYAHHRFTFLNHTVDLGRDIDWFPAQATQLWQYNLHYFDFTADLAQRFQRHTNDEAYAHFKALAESWIVNCRPTIAVAWDPYPISLRVSNWIKAFSWFEEPLQRDKEFAERLATSIYNQCSYLAENIEYHLLGNHLIENGRALLLAGRFFQDSEASDWGRQGRDILISELEEQFLGDGAHYERSPMYHQIMLHVYEDVLHLFSATDPQATILVQQRVDAMRTWLANMMHPDGDIALFNDAAFDIAVPVDRKSMDERQQDGLTAYPESGYFVFRDRRAGNCLIFDCGALGPDYQPGHAHCDTLSFELSVAGKRFITDSGVENYYGAAAWRAYYRSTRAHSTVSIDGAEQSEMWGRFRVARRAYPTAVCYGSKARVDYAIGSHTGFNRLPGRPQHRRWIGRIDRKFWLVCDRIDSHDDQPHGLESFLHFHPDVTFQPGSEDAFADGTSQIAQLDGCQLSIAPFGMQTLQVICAETDPIQGWYASEFGRRRPRTVWQLASEERLPHWMGAVIFPGAHELRITTAPAPDGRRIQLSTDQHDYTIVCTSNAIVLE